MELCDVLERDMEKLGSPSKSKGHVVLLWLLLVFAAYLRLFNISGYMTFLGDEGRDVLVVKRMIVDHKWTLLGPTASVGGFFLGPIYYYFMMPFLWMWRLDPTGPAVMVALFGIATVYLVYRAGRDMFHPWVGIVASTLYALSPVVIAYSRSSWNPNLVPFFSLLTIYWLWRFSVSGKYRYALLAGMGLGIGLQLHYLFLFLFPVAFLWVKPRMWIALGLGFVSGYAPFLLFELRHGFPNTRSIIQFILAGKDTGFSAQAYSATVSDVLFRTFGRLVLRLPPQDQWNHVAPWQRGIWEWSIGALLIASIAFLISSYHRHEPSRLLLLWGGVVTLLFGFYRRAIYDYYFGIWFAFPFLLTSLVLYQIRKIRFVGWAIAGGLVAFLAWWNWEGRPFRYAPNHQLAQTREIARQALDKTGGKPFNFALIAEGNSDHAYRYFFEIWGNPPVTIEPPFKDPQRRTVMDQLIVICEVSDCKPLGHPLWEVAGFGQATISGSWRASSVTVYKLVHGKNTP